MCIRDRVRLLRTIARAARRAHCETAVCGEMAGDPLYAPLLLALGLTEFSLHPNTLLEVRRVIRGCDLATLRNRLPLLMRARDRAAIEAWMQAQ